MTAWAYLLLICCSTSLPAAAVMVQAGRGGGRAAAAAAAGPPPPPLAFYALDSCLDDRGGALREAARRTWLQVVREVGDDYRFFGFDLPPKVLDPVDEPDFVVVPEEDYSDRLLIRQFRIIAFALRWALEHSAAGYVVKADHDTFLCAGHLHYEFANGRYPSQRFFMGDFWHKRGMHCRADQNFLLYTRDVLKLALEDYGIEPVEVDGKEANWAVSWGFVMRHLWSKGELTVADERGRFDSQQDWHDREDRGKLEAERVHPDATKIPRGYCGYKLGMHVRSKDTRVFDAIMAEGDRLMDYEATPALAPPACMNRNCSSQDWKDC